MPLVHEVESTNINHNLPLHVFHFIVQGCNKMPEVKIGLQYNFLFSCLMSLVAHSQTKYFLRNLDKGETILSKMSNPLCTSKKVYSGKLKVTFIKVKNLKNQNSFSN